MEEYGASTSSKKSTGATRIAARLPQKSSSEFLLFCVDWLRLRQSLI